jgi:ribonuclease HII
MAGMQRKGRGTGICGIDEAGRGPVMGPLVVAGVKVESKDVLMALDVRDSKKCTPKKREWLYGEIKKRCQCEVRVVSAREIDDLRKDITLNQLEVNVYADIVSALRPAKAYVDSVDTNEERFGKDILRQLDHEVDIVSRHKADDIYPEVGAASIIAKVERDRIVKAIGLEIGKDIGSGYPSDPVTQRFLRDWYSENGDLPPHTRRSWKTAKKIIEESQLRSLDSF